MRERIRRPTGTPSRIPSPPPSRGASPSAQRDRGSAEPPRASFDLSSIALSPPAGARPAWRAAVERAQEDRGAPLPSPLRADAEALAGRDLSGVRVHAGPRAHDAAAAVGARAFTVGQQIHFGAGESPDSHEGEALLFHELGHAAASRDQAATPTRVSARSEASERSADAFAARAAGMATAAMPMAAAPAGTLHRKTLHDHVKKSAIKGKAPLSDAQAKKAATFNNKHWSDPQRHDLLVYLRGTKTIPKNATFEASDSRIVARLQAGAGIAGPDGMIGDQTTAVLLHAGLELTRPKAKPGEVKLVFFPGELEDLDAWKKQHKKHSDEFRKIKKPAGIGKIYVYVKGQLVAKYDARGGPPYSFKDDKHTADPTPEGKYTLGSGRAHTSTSWTYSQIPWGAKIRQTGTGKDQHFEYKDPDSGTWIPATGDKSTLHGLSDSDFMEGGKPITEWRQNDFGPRAYLVDQSHAVYVHTTPDDEETTVKGDDPQLDYSHGCVHVKPAQRTEMESRGYLQKGVTFIVKKYTEHFLPQKLRNKLLK